MLHKTAHNKNSPRTKGLLRVLRAKIPSHNHTYALEAADMTEFEGIFARVGYFL